MKAYGVYSKIKGIKEYLQPFYFDPIKADNVRQEKSANSGKGKKLSICYGIEEVEIVE